MNFCYNNIYNLNEIGIGIAINKTITHLDMNFMSISLKSLIKLAKE